MRSFLYLDEYKLYSFSSQLFKGFVDQIVSVSERGKSRTDTVAGSAKTVADIAAETATVSEKKYLHDYAYDLFEEELRRTNALTVVDESSTIDQFHKTSVVRIAGCGLFQDFKRFRETIAEFNRLADAAAYMAAAAELPRLRAQGEAAIANARDRNEKERLRQQMKQLDAKGLSQRSGLRQDEEFIRQLCVLLDYTYGDKIVFQIPFQTSSGGLFFSAVLNRTFLREAETSLLHKYSRETDRAITVVGLPTQAGGQRPPLLAEVAGVRSATAELEKRLSELIMSVSGRYENEIIIDPIAVYVE